jgi:DNA-binding transcriptional LysR family regulator
MGGALFHRERRKIRLTPLGTCLLEEARPLLQQAQRAEQRLRDAAEGRIGEIRIAYTEAAFSEKVTRRIRKFLRKHRGVHFVLARQHPEDIHRLSSEFDAVIVDALELLPGAVVLEKAAAQIAVPPKHRLADRLEVALSDLIGESLILSPFQYSSNLEKALVKAIDTQGIKLNRVEGSLHFSDRMWQVSLGLGVTVCSSAHRPEFDDVRIPLNEPFGEVIIQCLPAPTTRAAVLTPFLEAIRE